MSRGIVLGMPLSEFLLDANRVAGAVTRHADSLSAASGGRVGAHTAREMQQLGDDILRIERERERKVVAPIRPLIQRAEALLSELAAAGKFVALTRPIVGERMKRIRRGPRRRSAHAVAWALELHLGLVRDHASDFATVLPAGMEEDAARTLAAMEEQRGARRAATGASTEQTRVRDESVARLQRIVSEVRLLAAACVRDVEAAAEFRATSSRS